MHKHFYTVSRTSIALIKTYLCKNSIAPVFLYWVRCDLGNLKKLFDIFNESCIIDRHLNKKGIEINVLKRIIWNFQIADCLNRNTKLFLLPCLYWLMLQSVSLSFFHCYRINLGAIKITGLYFYKSLPKLTKKYKNHRKDFYYS